MAEAPLQSDGRFQISIPDFSNDPVTIEKQSASLQFRVRDRKSSNIVANLTPPTGLRDGKTNDLKILPLYDSQIRFEIVPR